MTEKDLSQAQDADLPASMAALKRAAEMARQIAIQTNTEIVIVRGGKIESIPAKQLRKLARS
jgi:hypothetical protein